MKRYQIAFAVLLVGVIACSFPSTSQEDLTGGDSPISDLATHSPTSTHTPTPADTITLTPSSTPSATLTPTQLAPEFINAPVPDGAIARISRGYIQNAIVSPDGQYLALDTTTGLYLHETDTFKEIWNVSSLDNISSFTFSPDGGHLALGTDTGKVIYLDSASAEIGVEMPVSDIAISSISWSPDGNYVVARTENHIYILSNTGQPLNDIELPGGVNRVWIPDSDQMWLPDSSRLYLLDYPAIHLISFEEEIRLVETINFDLMWDAVLPLQDGLRYFANGMIYTWDGQEFHHEFTVTIDPPPGGLGNITWSPDGKYVAMSGGLSHYLLIFDIDKQEEIHRINTGLSDVKLLFFSPDSKTLFYVTRSGLLEWQVESGQLLRRLEGYTRTGSDWSTAPNSLSWSPDGTSLLVGYGSFEFTQLDALTFERIHQVYLRDWPYEFTWSDDGTLLYVEQFHPHDGASGTIWKIDTFEQVQRIPDQAAQGWLFGWSPGGELYIAQEYLQGDYSLGVYDGKTLKKLWSPPPVVYFEFSPDSNRLGIISDNQLTIYDARTGDHVQSIAFEIEGADEISWAPDGAHIAIGYRDIEGISIYDLSTGTRSLALEVGSGPIVYSPSGNVIAVGSGEGLVYLYDAANGSILRILDGHTDSITALAWKPDATQLASGSQDGTVVIWNLAS